MPELDNAVRASYRGAFLDALDQGAVKPFLIPFSLLGAFIVPALWLTIPHTSRPWLYRTRWAVMAFVALFNIHIVLFTSSTNFGWSYVCGVFPAWGIIVSLNFLIWKRPQFELARVIKVAKAETESEEEDCLEYATSNGHEALTNGALKHRGSSRKSSSRDLTRSRTCIEDGYECRWQTFPAEASFLVRLAWVVDLMTSFRGAGWNHSITSIPRPTIPRIIHPNAKVDCTSIPRQTPSGYSRPMTESEFLRGRLANIIPHYFILDFLTIQMMKDPYFILGPDNTYNLPSSLANKSPWVLLLYREILALVAIWASITSVFSLNDIVQYYLLKTFYPSRALLWSYASAYGGLSEILDRGIAGWWGVWWHQTFRLGFLGPSVYLFKKGYINKGTRAADAVGLFMTFLLSGILHALGSYATIPRTKPWRPLFFFLLQGLGIFIQQRLSLALRNQITGATIKMRQLGNLVFCLAWLYLTAPLFIDDLASAGLWLMEPVPISPLRYLSFGHPDDHWWRWDRYVLPKWYSVKHWWEAGIAL